MDYSERMLRREIEKLPDGTLRGRGPHRRLPRPPRPGLPRPADQGRGHGRRLRHHVDLTGTAPQVDLPINMPFVGTVDIAICVTLRSILLDAARTSRCRRTRASSGRSRSSAPEGCIANPSFPAPTIARFCGGNIIADTRHARPRAGRCPRASAPASATSRSSPTRASAAASTGSTWTSRRAATAAATARTASTPSTRSTRTRATTRSRTSSRTTRCGSRSTSCSRTGAGAGRWRGGLGSSREIEFLDDAGCSLEGDGNASAPPGLFGGEDGTPGRGRAQPRHAAASRAAVEVPVPQGGGGRPAAA